MNQCKLKLFQLFYFIFILLIFLIHSLGANDWFYENEFGTDDNCRKLIHQHKLLQKITIKNEKI
jgi:hypothetical protein